MSFNDTVDDLTGRQIKHVQALTGESIQKSTDVVGLIFAVAFVKQGGTDDQAGFDAFLDNTTYKQAATATGADDTAAGPKAEPSVD